MSMGFSGGTNAFRVLGSRLTNPVSGTELANTGALHGGAYLVGFLVSADAAAEININLLDSTGTATTWTLPVFLPANSGGGPLLIPVKDTVLASERYQVTMNANLTGHIACGIFGVNVG